MWVEILNIALIQYNDSKETWATTTTTKIQFATNERTKNGFAWSVSLNEVKFMSDYLEIYDKKIKSSNGYVNRYQ